MPGRLKKYSLVHCHRGRISPKPRRGFGCCPIRHSTRDLCLQSAVHRAFDREKIMQSDSPDKRLLGGEDRSPRGCDEIS
jgi:hypothetical protein